MVGYELSTAGVGVCIAYGLANVWNPTGWVALLVPVGYTAVTFFAGGALQTWFEEMIVSLFPFMVFMNL